MFSQKMDFLILYFFFCLSSVVEKVIGYPTGRPNQSKELMLFSVDKAGEILENKMLNDIRVSIAEYYQSINGRSLSSVVFTTKARDFNRIVSEDKLNKLIEEYNANSNIFEFVTTIDCCELTILLQRKNVEQAPKNKPKFVINESIMPYKPTFEWRNNDPIRSSDVEITREEVIELSKKSKLDDTTGDNNKYEEAVDTFVQKYLRWPTAYFVPYIQQNRNDEIKSNES